MRLNDGEVVSLLGPSGCGKTTLLKLASGIAKLQKGEIKLNDKIEIKKIRLTFNYLLK